MKALSIQQPWAWLIVNGYKDIENRDWPTARAGERILIHTGKKFDSDGDWWIRKNFPDIPLPNAFDLGGIVGEATITGCVQRSSSKWFFGRYGFVFANPRALQFRPLRGQLGFFEVSDSPAAHAQTQEVLDG